MFSKICTTYYLGILIDLQLVYGTEKYTQQKRQVVHIKDASISQKTFHDIVEMHIFLKLIQFTIFW